MHHMTQAHVQDEAVFMAWRLNECRQALDGAPPDPQCLSAGQRKEYNLTICRQTTKPMLTEKPIQVTSTLNQTDSPCWR